MIIFVIDHTLRRFFRFRLLSQWRADPGITGKTCKNQGVSSRLYRDEAIVLRTHKLGEADRIITLMTRQFGVVRAVARGVRKTTSRFGSRLEPFTHVDVQLHQGRSLDYITQAVTISPYSLSIARDYELYTRANAMTETTERLVGEEKEPATAIYLLLLGAINALARRRHDPELVLRSFLLRAMALSGWAPSFTGCASCGKAGPHRAFSIDGGGAVCAQCRPPHAHTIRAETMELGLNLLSGDWQAAESSTDITRVEISQLVTSYVQWHMERQVKSLRMVGVDL